MKKLLVVVFVLVSATVAVSAQAPPNPWTWELQGGYYASSNFMDSDWNASTGIAYAFTDHWKLAFHATYWDGKIKDSVGSAASNIWTFTIAPEYDYNLTEKDQIYAFIGAGVADMQSKEYWVRDGGLLRYVRQPSQSKWAGEAGFGYRRFFTRSVGMSFQLTYTHMGFDSIRYVSDKTDIVDARVGVVVRF